MVVLKYCICFSKITKGREEAYVKILCTIISLTSLGPAFLFSNGNFQ